MGLSRMEHWTPSGDTTETEESDHDDPSLGSPCDEPEELTLEASPHQESPSPHASQNMTPSKSCGPTPFCGVFYSVLIIMIMLVMMVVMITLFATRLVQSLTVS